MRPINQRRLREGQISELVVASYDGGRTDVIYETGELIEAPNWTPDGKWLIYNGDGRLFRISPDGSKGPTRINTAPIEDLNNDHLVSPDGRYLYVSANDGHLYRVKAEGGDPVRISNTYPPERGFRYYLHGISPDGGQLAYVGLETGSGKTVTRVFLIPASGGDDLALTDGSHPVDGPEFAPQGDWIYFNSEQGSSAPGHAQVFRMKPDGTGIEQLTFDERVNWFPHPSPDGRLIAYLSYPPGTVGHPADRDVIVRTMTPDGGSIRDIDRFNGGQGTINVASWSPDSCHFAYVRYPLRQVEA
ncbi:TolB family protein [Roseibium suaedae]|uniref:WD40-like Beta Propeller Repeat n=1 Tax=Roseibium suaedae TaxID=735517 RepID=A0A1M7NL73_9HYPH|nr:PD40 domain-containing protein [Roseibium suaedae]SHN04076.1 WD40-like Beta Propeller Repeat [Roseibium suaedae]